MNGRTYDISAFKNSIDIREVLGHFGYGTAINRNIKCPGNEHEDNKPSARIYLDKNICKCFSCDNRFSTIDIVMKNAEVETWQEACDYMIENFDCKGFYTDKNKENEEQENFPLTRQEILDLGLSPKSMFVENPFKPDEKIVSYEKLGAGRIVNVLPESICTAFISENFKPGEIDGIDEEILYTVKAFFENSLNISETARKMFIHRNTLIYRLNKLYNLIGLDVRNFDDAMTFKLTDMVNKRLKVIRNGQQSRE